MRGAKQRRRDDETSGIAASSELIQRMGGTPDWAEGWGLSSSVSPGDPGRRASDGCGLFAVVSNFPDQEQWRVQILNVGCVPWPEPANRSPVRRFPDSQNLTEVFYWWNTGGISSPICNH